MSQTTKEYFENALSKNERLHRKVDFQKTKIFFENEEATKARTHKKMLNENNKQEQEKEQRKGIKMVSIPTPGFNPIEHTTNPTPPIKRLAKVIYSI